MAEVLRIVTHRELMQNCYVVHDADGEGVVIDPGDDAGKIVETIENRGLRMNAILATHAHYDHIGAAAEVKAHLGVPFYLHRRDAKTLKYANLLEGVLKKGKKIRLPEVDSFFDAEGSVAFANLRIDVIETPGHSPGGVCFHVDNFLFTGDTVLEGRVGRVDLPGGDRAALLNSLGKLADRFPDAVVFPGHGEKSTVADELKFWHIGEK